MLHQLRHRSTSTSLVVVAPKISLAPKKICTAREWMLSTEGRRGQWLYAACLIMSQCDTVNDYTRTRFALLMSTTTTITTTMMKTITTHMPIARLVALAEAQRWGDETARGQKNVHATCHSCVCTCGINSIAATAAATVTSTFSCR